MLNKLVAIAGKIAQLTLLLRWNVTRFEKTGKQELAYPLAVHLVRLVTRHILDVTGINNPDILNGSFKYLVHWFPVNTGTLHCHMGNAVGQ